MLSGGVQRELARLVAAGLILRVPDGQQVYFSANPESPVFDDLRNLLAKTAGIADVIRSALAVFRTRGSIRIAFLYGSVASRSQKTTRDIDLMIVGRITLARLLPGLRSLQGRLGREINASIYAPEEFKLKYARREHFIRRVTERPRIMLVGTGNDLEELVGEPLDRRT